MTQEFKLLAEPLQIGPLQAKNRIWFAPMLTRYASVDGEVTQLLIDHYVARARAGVGLLVQEATAVDGRHRKEPEIRIDESRFITGLHRLVNAVHMYDVPIICQLRNAGMFGTNPISPSGVACYELAASRYITPRVLSLEEIEEISDLFVRAAVRAMEAEYDGVILHGATAYLLEQFFSPHTNKRTDKYGGSLEGRMRLPLEIVHGIRQQCGPDFSLGYTLFDADLLPDGVKTGDSITFAKALEQEGVSYIDLQMSGTYETFHWQTARGFCWRQKRGQFDIAEQFKKELRVPVITRSVGEWNPAVWEEAIQKGAADAVLVGRQYLADAELAAKVLEGRVEDIRPCIRCNYCLEVGRKTWALECTVNHALGRNEYEIQRAPVAKKVLVIGGGPGGLEAARVAALRGHNVTLMEKEAKLGGNMAIASLPIAKEELKSFIDWEERQCRKAGVNIELNKEATVEEVEKAKPDAVIVSTGASPLVPPIPGVEKPHVVTAADVLAEKTTVEKKVVVVGGGQVGVETADFMIEKGLAQDVTILEMLPAIAMDMDPMNKAYLMVNVMPKIRIKVFTNMNVMEITDKGVVALDKEWRRHEFQADIVILATGYTSNNALYEALKGRAAEVYIVGDSRKPRKIRNAVHEAAYFALQI